jgi:hypothetical protein
MGFMKITSELKIESFQGPAKQESSNLLRGKIGFSQAGFRVLHSDDCGWEQAFVESKDGVFGIWLNKLWYLLNKLW